jgi:lactoylglutathione lyase
MKFLHIKLRIKNSEESIKFYTENFNCKVINEKTSPIGNKLTFLSIPETNATLELCEFPNNINKDFRIEDDLFHLAFEVKNLKEALEKLKNNNVKIIEENDSMAFVEDPDGYEIELIEN